MKKLVSWAAALLTAAVIIITGTGTMHASQFFEFNKESIIACGYMDNLLLIQNSPGEFDAGDIIWMIDNDCLDMTGAKWCVDAGIVPEDALTRPALFEKKKKPQSIFDGSQPPQENVPSEAPDDGTSNNESVGSNSTQSGASVGNVMPGKEEGLMTEPDSQPFVTPEQEGVDIGKELTGKQEEIQAGEKPEEGRSYGHFYDELNTEAKQAYSYFKAKGENCFIQVHNTSENKTIEGKYLKTRPEAAGEIRFDTTDSTVLYSYVFKAPQVGDMDKIDMALDLEKEDTGKDTLERYILKLPAGYPNGIYVKVMVDRINQEYVMYHDGNVVGKFTSDYNGYLEVPASFAESSIECDVYVGNDKIETERNEVEETEEAAEETGVEEESNRFVLYACIAVAVLAICGAGFVMLRRKTYR